MNSPSDQRLLRDYVGSGSEAAFAELVRRHVNLVYSAALRMVHDAHLAEDLTQGAFVALAQNAAQLTNRPVLSGWLHRTTQNLAAKAVRSDVRRRAREREAAAMNELLAAEPDAVWEHVAPHLDAAIGELSEADRDALLLRYFERKSAQEMAQVLGVSDDAAQKRVSRAVERLRDLIAKRGVTVGAGGLVVLISTNAVLVAPAGLCAAITAGAVAAVTTVGLAQTAITAMSFMNTKSIVAMLGLALLAGTTVYLVEEQRLTKAAGRERVLREQQSQHTAARDAASVKASNSDVEKAQRDANDLARLRNEVTLLRQQAAAQKDAATPPPVAAVAAAPKPPGELITKEKLAFAGYATPEAAEQSLMWAMIATNWAVMTNSFDPSARKDFDDPQEKIDFAKNIGAEAARFEGMQILARKDIDDNNVELKIAVYDRDKEDIEVAGNNGEQKILAHKEDVSIEQMVRIDNEWKRHQSVSYNADWDRDPSVKKFADPSLRTVFPRIAAQLP